MSKLHIAIAVPVLAFGLNLPVWSQGANQQVDPNTGTPQPRQIDQPGTGTAPDSSGKTHPQPKKHPPTSVMDKAMSPQKSGDQPAATADQPGSDGSRAASKRPKAKHPPTAVMDKATSPQKSGDQPKSDDQPTTTGPAGER